MSNAIIIRADGTKEMTDNYALADLQKAVGGLIECVSLTKKENMDMWVNEEGKLLGLPQNPIATSLYVDEHGTRDVMVGDVIVTGGSDDEGETLPLTQTQIDLIMNYNGRIFLL